MTLQEATQEIRGRTKPYEQLKPRMAQSTFSNTIRAIERGDAKPVTVKNFMAKFGYEVEREMLWRKK
jgi:hypothetical protein